MSTRSFPLDMACLADRAGLDTRRIERVSRGPIRGMVWGRAVGTILPSESLGQRQKAEPAMRLRMLAVKTSS